MLARRAAQNEGVAAILDDGLGDAPAVSSRDLGDRLKAQDATAPELAQPRERVLESVDFAERIQLVDDEPEALISLIYYSL